MRIPIEKCPACNGSNIIYIETKISEFLSERIFGITDGTVIPVKLCYCKDCGFAWYDKKLNDTEEQKLYSGYRSEEYQIMRQKYEPYYTKEFNYFLGHDDISLLNSNELLSKILKKYIPNKITNGLDYDGDEGQKYPKDFPIDNKYVYDISGVKPLDGITNLSSYDDAKKINWDFIMCNHTLEHVGNIMEFIYLIKVLGSKNTWFYFEVPFDSPFYPWTIDAGIADKFKLEYRKIKINIAIKFNKVINVLFKKHYVCCMHEHVNYFTTNSINESLKKSGFTIYYNDVNFIDGKLGTSRVISVLCKLD